MLLSVRSSGVLLLGALLLLGARLFDRLEAEGAMSVPLRRGNWQADDRLRD